MHEHLGEKYQSLLIEYELIKNKETVTCQELWDIYKEIQIIDLPSVMRRTLNNKKDLPWVLGNFSTISPKQVFPWLNILFHVFTVYSEKSDQIYWKILNLPNLDLNYPGLHDVIKMGHDYSDDVVKDIIHRFNKHLLSDSLSSFLYHKELNIKQIDAILSQDLDYSAARNLQIMLDNPNLDKARVLLLRSILMKNNIPLSLRGILNHPQVSYDWIMDEIHSDSVVITTTDIINLNTVCHKYTPLQRLTLALKIPQLMELGFNSSALDVSIEVLAEK